MKKLLLLALFVFASLGIAEETGVNRVNIKPANGVTGSIRFFELVANGTNYVELRSQNALAANVIFYLPNADGTSGQALTTNGAGVMSWTTVAADLTNLNASNLTSGTVPLARLSGITNAEISNSAAIAVSKLGTGGTIPANSAANLTSIPAGNLTGSIADARLSANVPLLNADNIFTGANAFLSPLKINTETGGRNVRIRASSVNANNLDFFIPSTMAASDLFVFAGVTNTFGANQQIGNNAGTNYQLVFQAASGGNSGLQSDGAGGVKVTNGNTSLRALTASAFNGSGSGLTSIPAANLTGTYAALNGGAITNLNGAALQAGTVADAALSANVTLHGNTFNGASQLVQLDAGGLLPAVDGSAIQNLTGGNIAGNHDIQEAALPTSVQLYTSDYIPAFDNAQALGDPTHRFATLYATLIYGDGSGLTNLNGAALQAGTVSDAALSANVAFNNLDNNFSVDQTVTGIIANKPAGNFLISAPVASGTYIEIDAGSDAVSGGYGGGFTAYGGPATGVGGTGGEVELKSGFATAGANSGFVNIDAGNIVSGGGTGGPITLGTTNANSVTIGRTGKTTTINGTLSANGSSLTALNATQLTSGTVGTARLGSGSATSSTFLRGDSTWQTVSGGADASGLYVVTGTTNAPANAVTVPYLQNSWLRQAASPNAFDDYFPANASGWTAGNSATIGWASGMMTVTGAASAQNQFREAYKTVPATPYTITTMVYKARSIETSNHQTGVFLGDGTKLIVLVAQDGGTGTGQVMYLKKFSNANNGTQDSYSIIQSAGVNQLYWYYRVINDGTTITFQYSAEGVIWYTALSEAKATYLGTIDRFGVVANSANASETCYAICPFVKLTSP